MPDSQMNGLTSDQNAAVADILSQVNANPDAPEVKTVKSESSDKLARELAPDPSRASITLATLATQTGVTVAELYTRARGRGLLIEAPYRTASEKREIFRDQIDEVLVPKRNSPVATKQTVAAAEGVMSTSDAAKSACLKLIKLTKKGHFTAEEALVLIEAALNA